MKINLVRQSKIELAYGRKIHVYNFEDIKGSIDDLLRIRSNEGSIQALTTTNYFADSSVIVPDRFLLASAPDTFDVIGYDDTSYTEYQQYLSTSVRLEPIRTFKEVQLYPWTYQVPVDTVAITLDGNGDVIAWPTNDLVYLNSMENYIVGKIASELRGTKVGIYKGQDKPSPCILWELK